MANFRIRTATPKDYDVCLALDHTLETQYIWQMTLREDATGKKISFQTLRLPRSIRVEYPRSQQILAADFESLGGVLVAISDEVILGYVQIILTPSEGGAWLRNLVVDEAVRRHKVGSALLEQGMRWARLKSASHMMVETTTRSYPAIQMFQNRGFLFCGFNDRYYANQDIAIFFGQNL